jgi:hypothetical protein
MLDLTELLLINATTDITVSSFFLRLWRVVRSLRLGMLHHIDDYLNKNSKLACYPES